MENQRERMVSQIREKYGLGSPDVLSVMLQVPRHKFIAGDNRKLASKDAPVPIGFGQTISQPYTVAMMTDLLMSKRSKLKGKRQLRRVLEIGTGSGYQAAVLSKLFKEVYTVEIIPELAENAKKTLQKLRYKNVYVKTGSGEWGWKEKAPFDAIMITAGIEKVPDELFDQLKTEGVLVAPVGKGSDKVMIRYTKLKNEKTEKPSNKITKQLKTEKFGIFRFVPFIEEEN
jgi:protein-L-isoaspartate(D-aspartate) O-methyltransferase